MDADLHYRQRIFNNTRGGRRLVIPDIHGYARTFQALVQERLKLTRDDQLFLLGDYIDRGPDSVGVVDFVLELQRNDYQIHALRGNHEENFLESCEDYHTGIHQKTLRQLVKSQNLEGLEIVPYRGFGNGRDIFLKGRVLQNPHLILPRDRDSVWSNLLDSYRRFETDEMPGVDVEMTWNDTLHVATTDQEGFFTFQLQDLPASENSSVLWHRPTLRMVQQLSGEKIQTQAEVLIPPSYPQFGVISDIDDTVLVSDVTRVLRMVQLAVLHSARRRLPFDGVARFYQALQKGTQPGGFNPIFYVSSSPWNLYDLLVDFFRLQGIPAGPLMLRDYGFRRDPNSGSHQAHKLLQIKHIMGMYPQLPFILIGDSGQRDPEIYRQVVEEYPNRILAIYIRDVTRNRRDAAVRTLISQMQNSAVPMLLVPDTLTATQHAAENGWIKWPSP